MATYRTSPGPGTIKRPPLKEEPTAKREGEDEITEREVTSLLADFATVWSEFPGEQARGVQLLVERVDVQEGSRCGSRPRGSRA